jgi:hypothetical protein
MTPVFCFLLVGWVCFAIAARQRVHICFIELGELLVRPDPPPLSYSVSSYFGTGDWCTFFSRIRSLDLVGNITFASIRWLCDLVDPELRPLRLVPT